MPLEVRCAKEVAGAALKVAVASSSLQLAQSLQKPEEQLATLQANLRQAEERHRCLSDIAGKVATSSTFNAQQSHRTDVYSFGRLVLKAYLALCGEQLPLIGPSMRECSEVELMGYMVRGLRWQG